jgi:urease subunit alpha
MFGAFGRCRIEDSVTFVSHASLERIRRTGLAKTVLPVMHTRKINKHSMKLNDAVPKMQVDPETYEVRADGRLLTCEPAEVLPMAQRYFLY